MKAKLTTKQYLVPFVLITTLFFLWGFARAILDVLNQHFRDTLDISITQSSLIQVTTYLGYFLMAIPAGILINRYGYKRGVVFGLLLYALGAFLFIPSSHLGTLTAFLICLFIIACGLAILETAANPYATQLGPRETAAARLNLSQSFNGLGSCLAPALIGSFLFANGEEADVSVPYIIMGIVVVIVAIVFSFTQLPEVIASLEVKEVREVKDDTNCGAASHTSLTSSEAITSLTSLTSKGDKLPTLKSFSKLPEITKEDTPQETTTQVGNPLATLLKNKLFLFGVLALLAYEVAEISINSYFVLFVTGQGLLTPADASTLLSGALMFFMIGRFVGSWVMQRVSAQRTLHFCATGTVVCIIGIILTSIAETGETTSWTRYLPLLFLCGTYVFEAIMFPTIFSLAIRGLGNKTKTASSILMMTPVGGCAFLLVGILADRTGLVIPFVIPLVGYAVVWAYAHKLCRQP